jgi:hypothetical protein
MSLQITKIRGIPIGLHFTLIIVFFLIAWTLAGSLMPEIHPGLTRTEYWIIGKNSEKDRKYRSNFIAY